MSIDPEYLRRHYASLSDEARLDIDRAELVETAQKCYDEELQRRNLHSRGGSSAPSPEVEDKPEWFADGSEVFSQLDAAGLEPQTANARDALEAAGIPCYLELSDPPQEEPPTHRPMHLWRLLVPGNLNQRATSILERDIFNADFEAEWRTHLEMLTDEELSAMDPKEAFCGLFDRMDRVTRVFNEEVARRGSKSKGPWFH